MFRRRLQVAVAAVIVCGCVAVGTESSPRPNAMRSPYPFEPAEQLFYEGQFSKLLLRNLKVVELKFTASRTPSPPEPSAQPNRSATNLLFTGEATAKGFFSKLFGLHFHYRAESTVEPRSLTVLRATALYEQGKRRRTSETVFDRATNRIVWTQRNPDAPAQDAPRVVESPLGEATYDLVSALYYLRTQTLKPGARFELAISDSGRLYRVPVRVVESKRIKSAIGNFSATRVDLEVFGKDRPMEGDGQMSLWITNDKRRIPVLARVTTEVGTLEIVIKRVTGGAGT